MLQGNIFTSFEEMASGKTMVVYICTRSTAKHQQKRCITYLATNVKNKMSPDTCDLKK